MRITAVVVIVKQHLSGTLAAFVQLHDTASREFGCF